MSDEMTTIAKFGAAPQAEMVKEFLTDEGLECSLVKAAAGGTGLEGGGGGGLELQVKTKDLERAVVLMQQLAEEAANAEVDWAGVDPTWSGIEDDEEEVEHCPKCNSEDVFHKPIAPSVAFACVLLLCIPFLFMGKGWTCKACEHKW